MMMLINSWLNSIEYPACLVRLYDNDPLKAHILGKLFCVEPLERMNLLY